MSLLMPDYRTAGLLLLLTALATAISVPARLMAGADATPFTDSLAQGQALDAATIVQLELAEKLSAIGSAKIPYSIGGAARVVAGFTLVAVSIPALRLVGNVSRPAVWTAAALFVVSGLSSTVSGVAAIALAALAPEPPVTVALAPGGSLVSGAEQALFTARWAAGTLGFTLAGLALVSLAPVQWRMGGVMRISAVVSALLGLAMLFIWLDAATVVHRLTGIAFLIWLIVVGLWLLISQPQALEASAPARR